MDMIDTVRLDGVNPPVYYLGVKFISAFLGEGEAALRALSVIAGMFAVWIAYRVGLEVGGWIGGIAASWIWAFHPMTVWFSRDARPYALVAFLGITLVWLYLRLRNGGSLKLWLLAFLVLALGQLTHYFFFLLSGILVLISLVEIRDQPGLFRGTALITVAAFLPLGGWIGWYFSQPNPSLGIGWISHPVPSDIWLTLWNLLSGYGGVYTGATIIFGLGIGLLIVFSLRDPDQGGWMASIAGLGLLLPVGAVWILSQRRPVYVDRYFIVLLPLIAVMAAVGAKNVGVRFVNIVSLQRHGRVPIIVFFIMLAFGNWVGWRVHLNPGYAPEDWAGLVGYFRMHVEADSRVWFSEPEATIPFQYYLRGEVDAVLGTQPPQCLPACWWVIRQPYTETHAFSQAITNPLRPWVPEVPIECQVLERWDSPTGLRLWEVHCEEAFIGDT